MNVPPTLMGPSRLPRLSGRIGFLPLLVASALFCIPRSAARSEDLPSGPDLAAELRAQRPAEGLTNRGNLRLRDAEGRRREIPVTIVTRLDPAEWAVTYAATTPAGQETLTVVHRGDEPPRYLSSILPADAAAPGTAARQAGPGEGFVPFAGSDFWWCDLGLEFLHWPGQRVVKQELSNGRLCLALDSVNPGEGGYARIRSWIDAEYHALLRAEAYDAQGLLVKEFSTGSFRQIERPAGTALWVLKDLRIRDPRADSRTELVYDLPD